MKRGYHLKFELLNVYIWRQQRRSHPRPRPVYCVASKTSLLKVLMKRKLSLSYLKEVFKWQSNNLCSFWFSWFVFEIFQFVWYANDLSEKVIYLCHYQTKLIQRNHVRVFIQWHQTCRFSSHFVCQWQRYITFSDKSLCTCDV